MTIRQAISVCVVLTAIILGSNTVGAVHFLRDYQFEELEFTVQVDHGEVIGNGASSEQGLRLSNDPSQEPSGAQVSIHGIQGNAYLFFDWFVTKADASLGNYAFIKILKSPDGTVYFEKNLHDSSMERDQDSIRVYLKSGSTYTVKIGLHTAEPASDAYSLTIQNLKIRHYQSLELDSFSRNDPLFDLLIAPVSVDPETGNEPDNNNGANPTGSGPGYDTGDPLTRGPGPGSTGSGPGYYTGDPPKRGPGTGNTGSGTGFDTGDPPTRDPGTGNTGSGPDFDFGEPPTQDSGTSGSDFTDNAPNDPENNGLGTDEPIVPIVDPTAPGIIPNNPNSSPSLDLGTAPVLIRSDDFPFIEPAPNDTVTTGQVLIALNVPDSSLGFLPVATLIGLLFAKALMPSNPNRRRDQ